MAGATRSVKRWVESSLMGEAQQNKDDYDGKATLGPRAAWNVKSVPLASWRQIAMSSDGMRLAVVVDEREDIWTSSNGGETWSQHKPFERWLHWQAITSSSDGSKLVALVNEGNIWTSRDFGRTWVEDKSIGPDKLFGSVTSSDTGEKLAVVTSASSDTPRSLYTSSNGGITWVDRTPATAAGGFWRAIVCSGDGSKIVAVTSPNGPNHLGGEIWISSNNFGTPWIRRAPGGGRIPWQAITCSNNGSKLAAAPNLGNIWTSSDGGSTWLEDASVGSIKRWASITSSADGSRLVAMLERRGIWTSSDGGSTWVEDASIGPEFPEANGGWFGALSSDGSKIAAVGVGDKFLIGTYKWPCKAPSVLDQANAGACTEGADIEDGAKCTPQCKIGYVPSIASLTCTQSGFVPDMFVCQISALQMLSVVAICCVSIALGCICWRRERIRRWLRGLQEPSEDMTEMASTSTMETMDEAAAPASAYVSGPSPTATAAINSTPVAPKIGDTKRRKRWGAGLEAPAAGARSIYPNGYIVKREVRASMLEFGLTEAQLDDVMANGQRLSTPSLAPRHAAAIYGYTLEDPNIYKALNYALYTPGAETDKELVRYRDYIKHLTTAASALPNYVGKTYRGTDRIFKPSLYKEGDIITWQAFSSSSLSQLVASGFITTLPGNKLSGSLFILEVSAAKKITAFSAIPAEQEVLVLPNTHFKVLKRLTADEEKNNALVDLSGYNMQDLNVYLMEEM